MNIFKTILIAILASLATWWVLPQQPGQGVKAKETTFERVMRTNVLRCGYYNFPPVMIMYDEQGKKNPTGFSVDLLQTIGQKTGLKIEWTEEVTFGNWPQALDAGRVDAMCTPIWPDAPLGRVVLFTRPMFYSTMAPLVRTDDARFGNDVARLNQPDITFLVQDGNALVELTKQFFPKAKILAIAANVDGASAIENIITKKADAIILDKNAVYEYNKRASKNLLRMVDAENPLKYQPATMAVSVKEPALQAFLDNALNDLYYTGTIDYILKKWEAEPNLYARDAK
jgi:ABC-type amino acid transport substrate-binding protein